MRQIVPEYRASTLAAETRGSGRKTGARACRRQTGPAQTAAEYDPRPRPPFWRTRYGRTGRSTAARVLMLDLLSIVPYYTSELSAALLRRGDVRLELGAITYYLDRGLL